MADPTPGSSINLPGWVDSLLAGAGVLLARIWFERRKIKKAEEEAEEESSQGAILKLKDSEEHRLERRIGQVEREVAALNSSLNSTQRELTEHITEAKPMMQRLVQLETRTEQQIKRVEEKVAGVEVAIVALRTENAALTRESISATLEVKHIVSLMAQRDRRRLPSDLEEETSG